MKNCPFILLMILFANSALAQKGEPLIKQSPDSKQIEALLEQGFHFNEKAPNRLVIDERVARLVIEPRKITATDLPDDWKSGRIHLYVCDDAVTFCHIYQKDLGTTVTKFKPPRTTDFQKAFARAQKLKRPVLIDFHARWCPGCLRLENEIFGTQEFRNLARKFVFLRLDTDRFENSIFQEKYSVKAIPTLLVLSPDQREIGRVVDYQPMNRLSQFLGEVSKDPVPIEDLLPSDARLGRRLLAAGRIEEALKVLSKTVPPAPELFDAEFELAQQYLEDSTKKAEGISRISALVKQEPSSMRSLIWRTRLIEVTDSISEKARLVAEGRQVAETLLSSPLNFVRTSNSDLIGEFSGFESLFIATLKADLIDAGPDNEELKLRAWRDAAKVGTDAKIPIEKLGPSMRHLLTLVHAKMYREAEELALAIKRRHPESVDVDRRRARILFEQKKFSESIELSRKVLKRSFGRNEYLAVEILVKALAGNNQNDEAKKIARDYLNRPDSLWPSVKSIRATLEKL